MPFNKIATNQRSVAGPKVAGYAELFCDGCHIFDVLHENLEAMRSKVNNPLSAAAASRRLINMDNHCIRGARTSSEGHHQANNE